MESKTSQLYYSYHDLQMAYVKGLEVAVIVIEMMVGLSAENQLKAAELIRTLIQKNKIAYIKPLDIEET